MSVLDCIVKASKAVGAFLKSPFFMIASALDVLDNTLDIGERIISAIENAKTKKNATKQILAMSEDANEYNLTSFFEKAEFDENKSKNFKDFNNKSQKEQIKILIACYQNSKSFEEAIRDIVKPGKLKSDEYEKYINLFCVFYNEVFLEFDFDSLDKQGKALYRSLTANFSEQISEKFGKQNINNQDPFIQELKTTLDTIMLILAQNQEDRAQKITVSNKPLQYIVRQCPECGYRGKHISYSDDGWCYCSACGTTYMAYKNDPELVTVVQNGVNEILSKIEKDKSWTNENLQEIKKTLIEKFEGVLTTEEFNNALQNQNDNLTKFFETEITKVKKVFLGQFDSIEKKLNDQSDKFDFIISWLNKINFKSLQDKLENIEKTGEETNDTTKEILDKINGIGSTVGDIKAMLEISSTGQTNDVSKKSDLKTAQPDKIEKYNIDITITEEVGKDTSDIPTAETTEKSSKSENIFTITDGCKIIEAYAFKDRVNLERVIIPDSVKVIGKAAFKGCGLTSIIIPNSITHIDESAFEGCGLTSIIIPDSVEKICDYAFKGCTSLENITIPEGVKVIGKAAFNGCGLTSLKIPKSVTEIGESAFDNCIGLNTIVSASNLLKQGELTFGNRFCLKYITIPNRVIEIGASAFRGCSNLESIFIPESVKVICESAFEGCSGLTIYCEAPSQPSSWNSSWNNSRTVYYGMNSKNYIGVDCEFELRDDELVLERYTGLSSALVIPTQVTLGAITHQVTSIGNWAFNDCSSLTSITIPASVTSIRNGAFGGCSGLTSITIPNSVTSIGDYAFSRCSGLTSITIPASVTSIGDRAFSGCSSLTSITIPNSVTSIGESAFWGCSSLTSITIPNSVTSIGAHAFIDCSGLTSITIPASVTYIGAHAFIDCSGLTSITIPASVTYIGWFAFDGWESNQKIYIKGRKSVKGWDKEWKKDCKAKIYWNC